MPVIRLTCFSIVAFAAVALFLAACTPNYGTAAASGASDDRRVCVREKVTGSHIPRRTCKTPEQIEAERERSKEAGRAIQEQPTVLGTGASGT